MQNEVSRLYKVPLQKVKVIPPESANWIQNILETYKAVAEAPT
jgi:hypothetical protein